MAVAPDGADARPSSDDPVLSGALAELSSEGTISANDSIGDLGDPAAASPADGGSSAASASATPDGRGDDGAAARNAGEGTPAADSSAETDPLAGTEPFTYAEGKTLDGVYRVPGEGLLVPEDKVASIQQLAVERDTLAGANRDLSTTRDTFERLASWTTTDAQGQAQTLTGLTGLEAMRVSESTKTAALEVLGSLFRPDQNGDYPKLANLLATELVPDGRGGQRERLVISPSAIAHLLTESELAETRAEQRTRTQFSSLLTPPAPAAQATDYTSAAPRLIQAVASAAKLDASVLTPQQRELLAKQLPFHVQDGKASVAWQDLVADMIGARTDAKKAAEAAERAGKLNAGMERGRQPAKAQPSAKPATPAPKTTDRAKPDWDGPLTSALAEMAIPR